MRRTSQEPCRPYGFNPLELNRFAVDKKERRRGPARLAPPSRLPLLRFTVPAYFSDPLRHPPRWTPLASSLLLCGTMRGVLSRLVPHSLAKEPAMRPLRPCQTTLAWIPMQGKPTNKWPCTDSRFPRIRCFLDWPCPNDVFLVGDARQRIYGPKVVLSAGYGLPLTPCA